jgi:hypothetical protein
LLGCGAALSRANGDRPGDQIDVDEVRKASLLGRILLGEGGLASPFGPAMMTIQGHSAALLTYAS